MLEFEIVTRNELDILCLMLFEGLTWFHIEIEEQFCLQLRSKRHSASLT